MPKDELEVNTLELAEKEFDDAWNDDANGEDDSFDDDVDDDTSDEEAVEDDEGEDGTDELEGGSDNDEDTDSSDSGLNDLSKDEQRLKSWEGRLKADEARLKQEREKLETPRMDSNDDDGGDDDDNQDTGDDDSPDEFEEEFPEVADFVKKHIQPIQEQLSKAQLEQQKKAEEAHFKRITVSHPDAFDVAKSEDFKTWIEDQPFRKAQEYLQVQQAGTPEQVISMLDDFKSNKPNKSNAALTKSPSNVVKTRRTAKPKGRVGKNDFDGAWEAANQS